MKSGDLQKSLRVGGAALALLCLVPACGGEGDDDDATPTPGSEATDPPVATDTPAEVTDPPASSEGFPNGDFVGISPYLFSFSSVPYAFQAQMLTTSDGNGGMAGLYLWVFWASKASAQADEDPACILIDSVTGPSAEYGANSDIDYDSCVFCSGYWEVAQTYDSQEGDGCAEYYDFWYVNSEGEEVLSFDQYMGYRDAESDGWPAEYADISASLEEFGYVGSLYDQVAADPGAFFPMFAIAPYEASRRAPMSMPALQEVEVGSAAEARSWLK